jgi:hypothetical protein
VLLQHTLSKLHDAYARARRGPWRMPRTWRQLKHTTLLLRRTRSTGLRWQWPDHLGGMGGGQAPTSGAGVLLTGLYLQAVS